MQILKGNITLLFYFKEQYLLLLL